MAIEVDRDLDAVLMQSQEQYIQTEMLIQKSKALGARISKTGDDVREFSEVVRRIDAKRHPRGC